MNAIGTNANRRIAGAFNPTSSLTKPSDAARL
jgi:hypothetical protein